MEAIVLRENFKKALSFVGKNISTRAQLPILSHVLIEVKEGKIKLSSTNLETSITFQTGATDTKTGAITVPARLLTELITSFSQEKINLSLDKDTLKLLCGESEATLKGIDAGEYPALPQPGKQKDATVTKEAFEGGLPFTLIAASTDEGRPVLTGVGVFEKQKQMVMVATDGYRLSVKNLPQISGFKQGVIIPARALGEVYRIMIEEKAEKIDLYFSKDKNQVVFLLPNVMVATRLIEGEFPEYEKIIPAESKTRVVFEKEELLNAIKFAAVFAKEAANILRFKIVNNQAVISASSAQIGKNKTTIAVDQKGDGGEIAFNARFLLDLLSVFPENQVVFEMNDSLSPGVFRPQKDTSYLHIIMPVRVQE